MPLPKDHQKKDASSLANTNMDPPLFCLENRKKFVELTFFLTEALLEKAEQYLSMLKLILGANLITLQRAV